jgi:hypothetical protein
MPAPRRASTLAWPYASRAPGAVPLLPYKRVLAFFAAAIFMGKRNYYNYQSLI